MVAIQVLSLLWITERNINPRAITWLWEGHIYWCRRKRFLVSPHGRSMSFASSPKKVRYGWRRHYGAIMRVSDSPAGCPCWGKPRDVRSSHVFTFLEKLVMYENERRYILLLSHHKSYIEMILCRTRERFWSWFILFFRYISLSCSRKYYWYYEYNPPYRIKER